MHWLVITTTLLLLFTNNVSAMETQCYVNKPPWYPSKTIWCYSEPSDSDRASSPQWAVYSESQHAGNIHDYDYDRYSS